MNFAGAIVDKDDESKWQIVNDRLSDCSSDRNKLAFSVFAYVARYNSSWTNQQAFFDHGSGPVYQDYLKEHGHLFVQAGPNSTTHPYMTTSVLKRFAGFFRKEAFIK
jgi:hypothetical protein